VQLADPAVPTATANLILYAQTEIPAAAMEETEIIALHPYNVTKDCSVLTEIHVQIMAIQAVHVLQRANVLKDLSVKMGNALARQTRIMFVQIMHARPFPVPEQTCAILTMSAKVLSTVRASQTAIVKSV